MKEVSVYRFDERKLDSIIGQGFNDFKLDEKLRKIKSVFIKPNLVTDVPEYIKNGANTDVRVIESIIKHLSKFRNLKIYLGESDTGTNVKGRKIELALKYMGVYDLKKKYKFEIINLTQDNKITVTIPNGKFLKKVDMSKIFMDCDMIINIPKIKTHKYSTITCALKNMFGSIPDPMRIVYHANIHQTLADLNSVLYKKTFVVVDGIIGMEGAGPMYGKPVKLNILMFSDNPLASDIAACRVIGISPEEVKHVKYFSDATKQGFEINVKGELPVHKFERAHKTWFIFIEEHLMQHRWLVKIIFNDWVRKNITYRFRGILKKLRGGSYSWYYNETTSKNKK
jgi:uncharacterized protein (DUF362 family)